MERPLKIKYAGAYHMYQPKISSLVIILIIAAVQTAGCTYRARLVGEYDEITDEAVTELHAKTKVFFARLTRASEHDRLYAANKIFYEDSQGDIAVLIVRAEATEKGLNKKPLTKNFKDLQRQYDDLELLHKTRPSKKALQSAEAAFDRSFRAIVENLLYLRWNQSKRKARARE
jgi:hypothetical protein